MELKVNIQVSVDGVYQSNGGRHPDFDPGMERGGWARPLFDDESLAYVGDYYERADAFLFGRRTYEMFAWSWGTGTWGSDQGDNPISTALNTRPKYVATTTLTDPAWANTTVLSGDLASAIRELKTPPGGELQVHGSGTRPLAAGKRPRRRAHPSRVPRDRRPGRAAVPRTRPRSGARTDSDAGLPEGNHPADVPARRTPPVRVRPHQVRIRRPS